MVNIKKKVSSSSSSSNNSVWLLVVLLTIIYYVVFFYYVKNNNIDINNIITPSPSPSPSSTLLISTLSTNKVKKKQSILTSTTTIKHDGILRQPRRIDKTNDRVKKELKKNFIYILLQPSPVDIKYRLSRLHNIDNGWSQWTDHLSELHQVVNIYASTVDYVNNNTFHNINTIPLDNIDTSSASDFLVQAFSYLVLQVHVPRWLVFANDHTFIVPPNLVCFLRQHDPDLPIYTGNRLQRGDYKGTHLYFASGGAGAVLSHTALKSIIFAWIVTGDNKMTTIITNTINKMPSQICPKDNFSTNENGEKILLVDAKTGSFYCATIMLMDWLKSANNNTISIPLLRLYISEKRSIILAKKHHNKIHIELYEKNYVLKGIDINNIIKHCATDSEWAKINPGIVIANCLQVLFLGDFIHSEVDKTSERFNCFGLVRTITGDVDGWYIEAKNELPPGRLEMTGGFEPKPLSIAKDIISLHYISEMESKLLYDILSEQIQPQNSEALKRLWPQTGQQIGAYSRKVKDSLEYEALYSFIMRKAKVYTYDNCRK